MGPIDVFWHLANLLAPALGMALIAPTLAKLLCRDALRGKGWWTIVGWVSLANSVALVVALVLLGRDGRMVTYAVLVVTTTAMLWWRGVR